MHKTRKLHLLRSGKTAKVKIPLNNSDVLVRTGMGDTISSFYKSIMYSYSKNFPYTDEKNQEKTISKLRQSVFKPSENEWYRASSDMIYIVPYQERVKELFIAFEKFLTNGYSEGNVFKSIVKTSKEKKAFKLMMDILNLSTLGNEIDSIFERYKNTNIPKWTSLLKISIANLYKVNLSKLGEKRRQKSRQLINFKTNLCIDLLKKLLEVIFLNAENISKKKYINDINSTPKSYISKRDIAVLADRLNRDIFVLDRKGRPLIISSIKNKPKAIIIIRIGSEYEPIGKYLNKKKIRREFQSNELFITNMIEYIIAAKKNGFKDSVDNDDD